MTEEDVLLEVLETLIEIKIPYALTGGLAVSFYGNPRSTHDFDLIVQIPHDPKMIKKLLAVFGKDYYISEEGIIDALLHKTMFNIIHHETGLKIDFWILKGDAYDHEAFLCRKQKKLMGKDIFILSAEDMIINKLLWYKVSEIYKHLNDAKGIYRIQGDKLDQKYLTEWADRLSITEFLKVL